MTRFTFENHILELVTFLKPIHASHIDKANAKSSQHIVFRTPEFPISVINFHNSNAPTLATNKRWQKTMHMFKIGQAKVCLFWEYFQPTPRVRRIITKHLSSYSICDLRLKSFPGGIPSCFCDTRQYRNGCQGEIGLLLLVKEVYLQDHFAHPHQG